MARKNSIIQATVDGSELTFDVQTAGTFTIDANALSEAIRHEALIHGLRQKISDGAAIPKDQLPDDPEEAAKLKFDAMREIADRLLAGDWKAARGDGSSPQPGIIFRAYCEFARSQKGGKNLTDEILREKFETTRRNLAARFEISERAAQIRIGQNPEIAKIIERMKSERGTNAGQISADDLLGDLGL